MNPVLKVVGGLGMGAVLAGAGYAAGATLQDPRIETKTVAETEWREVEVPGPVQWKTKRVPVVPEACRRAVEAGNEMARMVDDYGYDANGRYGLVVTYDKLAGDFESLVVDTYNMVSEAYNAGQRGEPSVLISNNLDQIEDRRDDLIARIEDARATDDDLWQTWLDTPWYRSADACVEK